MSEIETLLAELRKQVEAQVRSGVADIPDKLRRRQQNAKEMREDLSKWWTGIKDKSAFRMIQWAIITVMMMFASREWVTDPQWQAGLWKLGLVSGGGYMGYWISRTVSRIRPHEIESLVVRSEYERNRAIIVGFAMLAAAFG